MAIIKILPEHIANKIAAGEVVQRPESVVKELIENSLDANAKTIEVIIKKAGKSLIQVIDDGNGMSEEDALLSVHKHATSKIHSVEDLDNIRTYGFRGEALSSIAAVSQLEIKTQTAEQELGTYIRIEEGGKIIKEKGAYSKGTSVSVKNLFYNTPARRNFLRTDATELKHIIDTFNKEALAHPEINFILYVDEQVMHNYVSTDLMGRIENIFGTKVIESVIPVEQPGEYIAVKGVIGKPILLKQNKGDQYLFLNNRYIHSKQVSHAVFSAYENILDKGDYPFFILYLNIDPKRVDVNVHPSKLEVRFDDEKDIYNFILAVVRKSLAMVDLVPSLVFTGDETVFPNQNKLRLQPTKILPEDLTSDRPIFSKQNFQPIEKKYTDEEIDLIFGSINYNIKKDNKTPVILPFDQDSQVQKIETEEKFSREEDKTDPFIFQLHNKYILSQIKTGLLIIDQHVAHERILYEKAIKSFEAEMPFSQFILIPKTIQVDSGRFQLLKELHTLLINLGFVIKFFSNNTIIIEGVPQYVKMGSEEDILLEILEEYEFNRNEKKITDIKDNLAKSYACRASIKAGDKLTETEMKQLIDNLFATSMPYVCPHGRPTVVKISLSEFDKRFGRTS